MTFSVWMYVTFVVMAYEKTNLFVTDLTAGCSVLFKKDFAEILWLLTKKTVHLHCGSYLKTLKPGVFNSPSLKALS